MMANGRASLGRPLGAQQHALLAGEYETMLSCVRCGLCLTSCPTYILSGHEAEGPRGRVAMMRGLVEGKLHLTPDLVAHETNCLVCDACSAVCPTGVHMDVLQVVLRSAMAAAVRRPPWQRLAFRGIFADMDRLRLFVRALRLYQRLGLQSALRRSGLLRLVRLDSADALLPSLPPEGSFLVPRGEVYPPDGEARPGQAGERRAALFAGCVMSTALAGIDRATIRVMRRAGWTVGLTAAQGCCGALHAHGGDLAGALLLAKRNIEAFEAAPGHLIVVKSAGCGAMLKGYAHYLRDDAWATRAKAFSARVKDVTEVLVPADLPTRRWLAGSVTYQEPCHLIHAQRISAQPRALLRSIPGLELREMADSDLCCGSAGLYNLTNPRESRELQARKLDHAAKTGADIIVTANPGCYLQLKSGLEARGSRMRVKHIVEILDEATAPVTQAEHGGYYAPQR
ncbi:MAG TPA: heterodisulfide reductase-related iron-sulfur binding cluster [Chloroflexota bacterium]|nr:heterodisulfide reductase-related iron-sulfur binding cluster [Chloroflexota bacterium]